MSCNPKKPECTGTESSPASAKEIFTDEELLRYIELRDAEKHPLHSREQQIFYMVWLLWKAPPGSAYAVLLNSKDRVVKSLRIKEEGIWQAQLFAQLVRNAHETGAVRYFVGHNHVGHPLIPSPEDLEITHTMRRFAGMEFCGHFITDSGFSYFVIE